MLVPSRHGSSDSYRYGFQGQEKDDELKGEGNSLNYTFRMHDPRVGRFFAVDPLTSKYPWLSPYQFSGNRITDAVELEGLESAYLSVQGIPDNERNAVLKGQQTAHKKGGLVAVTTAAIVLDAIYTRGFFMKTLSGAGLLESINETERGHDAQAKGNSAEARRRYANAGEASKLAIFEGVGFIAAKGVGEIFFYTQARIALAKEIYSEAGFAESQIADHIKGIDFTEAVFTKTYKKGTVLEQWTYLDRVTGEPKIGNYFTLPGANPNTLGIPLEGRVKTSLILLEDVKFLQSKTSDIMDWTIPGRELKGGGTQLFQTNVKSEILK